jgi:hypothetical protein
MIIGVYTGAAGYLACKTLENSSQSGSDQSVEYKGLNFENKENLRAFLHDSESAKLFPWIFSLPQELIPLITSISFGLLGGVALLLKKNAIDHTAISSLPVVVMPVFGSIIGTMLFFLSFLIPAIFVDGRYQTRTEAFVGLSLFGGAFSEQAYLWISEQVVGKLFPSEP